MDMPGGGGGGGGGGGRGRAPPPPRFYVEPLMPHPEDVMPMVVLYDARDNWEQEAKEYRRSIESRLAGDAALAEQARQIRADAPDAAPLDRLRAVGRYLQTHFAYKAIAFGPRARVPNTCADIIRNRYGDCKDQALLVHLLLKELGIPSQLALVRTEAALHPEAASLDQFDHMIVYVPDCGGASWWVDTTSKDTDPVQPAPTPWIRGRHALLLDERSPRLVKLPEWDYRSSGIEVDRTIAVQPDGEMKVQDHVVFSGLSAFGMRASLRATDADRRAESAVRQLGIDPATVRDWSAKIDDLEDVLRPLTLNVSYAPRQKLRAAGGRLIGEMPALIERQYVLPDVVQDRHMPFRIQLGTNLRAHVDLRLPDGWTLESLPDAPTDLKTAYGHARLAMKPSPQGAAGTLEVDTPPGLFPPEKYADFCESRQTIADTWAMPLILRKAGK
jgi:hypothetical protein